MIMVVCCLVKVDVCVAADNGMLALLSQWFVRRYLLQ